MLGSSLLSADLELTPDVREDHATFIGSRIKVLKNDTPAIFTAASSSWARSATSTAGDGLSSSIF